MEIASAYTWRRDREQKRGYYLRARVAEYWMVDGEAREVTVARAGEDDLVVRDTMTWFPTGASAPLQFDLAEVWPGA